MKMHNDVLGEKDVILRIVNRVYDQGYDKGYRDCQIEEEFDEDRAIAIEDSYQKGLNDAWECAKKIGAVNQLTLEKIGFDFSEMKPEESWNPSWWVINHYSASEAIAKIKEYEEKQKANKEIIQVGDEVVHDEGFNAVVTRVHGEKRIALVYDDGSCNNDVLKERVKKTGRHFDIQSILDQMNDEQ